MTYKDVMKQIKDKENTLKSFRKHNMPKERDFGKSKHKCRRCGRTGRGIIKKYGLNYCRQCFREIAEKIGFKKLS